MDMLLKNNGFNVIGSCVCGNLPQRKWQNPQYYRYKVTVFSTRSMYYIWLYNKRVTQGTTVEQLREWLEGIE